MLPSYVSNLNVLLHTEEAFAFQLQFGHHRKMRLLLLTILILYAISYSEAKGDYSSLREKRQTSSYIPIGQLCVCPRPRHRRSADIPNSQLCKCPLPRHKREAQIPSSQLCVCPTSRGKRGADVPTSQLCMCPRPVG